MSRVNDTYPLCHRVNGSVVIHVSGYIDLCLFFHDILHETLARAGADSGPFHLCIQTAVNRHMRKLKLFFYKQRAVFQRHFTGKGTDSSDSFSSLPLLKSHFQHFTVCQLKDIRAQVRHAQNVKVGMHGIITDMIPDQSNDPAADKILRHHAFHTVKNQRMVGDHHIRAEINGCLQSLICHIKRKEDFFDFPLPVASQKPHIVPALRKGRVIFFFQNFYNLFTFHICCLACF